MNADARTEIRRVIREHARLPVDVDTLDDGADLFAAGMTSHASVNLMLALEDAFDLEFPDRMLTRGVFESVGAIGAAIAELAPSPNGDRPGEAMSVVVDSERAFLAEIRRIAEEVAGGAADEVDRDARFPSEALEALRGAGALSAAIPDALGGDGVSLETIARCCFELGRRCSSTAMVFAMHQIQVITIARHLERAVVRELPAGARSGAAAGRLGDLRGRNRR
jgi:acyl carrier protein